MRALTVRGWGAAAAVAVLIAVVIAAMVVSATGGGGQRPRPPADASLGAALSRCRDLGAAAENDPTCHETWRRLSEHFLGEEAKASGHE